MRFFFFNLKIPTTKGSEDVWNSFLKCQDSSHVGSLPSHWLFSSSLGAKTWNTLFVLFGVVAVVQSLSHVWLFVTPWTAACQASLSFTMSQSLLKFTSISWLCYLTISSSAILFSFCLKSFPASRSFPKNQLFASDGQSIGVPASASVLPVDIWGWFPLGWLP